MLARDKLARGKKSKVWEMLLLPELRGLEFGGSLDQHVASAGATSARQAAAARGRLVLRPKVRLRSSLEDGAPTLPSRGDRGRPRFRFRIPMLRAPAAGVES